MKTINYCIKFAQIIGIMVFLAAFPACEQRTSEPVTSASESLEKSKISSPRPLISPTDRHYRELAERNRELEEMRRELDLEMRQRKELEILRNLEMRRRAESARERYEARQEAERRAESGEFRRFQESLKGKLYRGPSEYHRKGSEYRVEKSRNKTEKPQPTYTPAGREFSAPQTPLPNVPVDSPTPY